MWLQEPGSFTRIIAAMVAPRNTSSETMRPPRAVSAAAGMLEADAAIVSEVAMPGPSNGGDSTAAAEMPQCPSGERVHKEKWPGGRPRHLFCEQEETHTIPSPGLRV